MRQHFLFDDIVFEQGIAHDGKLPIQFKRVAEKNPDNAFHFLDYVIVPPKADIGIHTHAKDNQEIYIIIEGKAEMTVEGKTIQVCKGHTIVNQIGGTHSLVNTGMEDLKLIVIEIPASI
ncbi:MAG: cupin domain-containing protein [Bacteroidota bacterium]